MIKETFDNDKTFSFDLISLDTIFKEIVSLDTNKSTYSNDVPAKKTPVHKKVQQSKKKLHQSIKKN